MDFDDFERADRERKRRRFALFQDAFDKAMRDKGDPRTLDDLMGQRRQGGPPPPQDNGGPSQAQQDLMETAMEISDATGMSPKTSVLYAMGICRSIIRHQIAGGTVQFVDADGNTKTLKSKVK